MVAACGERPGLARVSTWKLVPLSPQRPATQTRERAGKGQGESLASPPTQNRGDCGEIEIFREESQEARTGDLLRKELGTGYMRGQAGDVQKREACWQMGGGRVGPWMNRQEALVHLPNSRRHCQPWFGVPSASQGCALPSS